MEKVSKETLVTTIENWLIDKYLDLDKDYLLTNTINMLRAYSSSKHFNPHEDDNILVDGGLTQLITSSLVSMMLDNSVFVPAPEGEGIEYEDKDFSHRVLITSDKGLHIQKLFDCMGIFYLNGINFFMAGLVYIDSNIVQVNGEQDMFLNENNFNFFMDQAKKRMQANDSKLVVFICSNDNDDTINELLKNYPNAISVQLPFAVTDMIQIADSVRSDVSGFY